MPTSEEQLDAKIRALVVELIESSPPPPLFSTITATPQIASRVPRSKARRTRTISIAMSLVGITAVSVLLVVILPSASQRIPVAAAAQLRLIAANTEGQPVPTLGRGQWLKIGAQSSNFVNVTGIGSAAVSDATASIPETVTQWSDNFGQTCSTTKFGQAQFASPANQAAWNAIGLSDTPTQLPTTTPTIPTTAGCVVNSGTNASNGGGLATGGLGVTDVSSLSRDPTTLAHELTLGTTGIVGIDHLTVLPGQNPGFARVVPLLVGPLTGTSPALNAAIYRALAVLPGVRALGETSTHTGTTGLGFDAPGSSPASNITIVVNPDTGALLEARNIGVPGAASDAIRAFATPALSPTQSWTEQSSIEWLDPIGPVQVVGTSDLPSTLNPQAPPTAVITAVTRPGTTESQLTALDEQLEGQFGLLTVTGMENESPENGGATTVTFTLGGDASKVPAIARAVRDSPLFSSVTVNLGDT